MQRRICHTKDIFSGGTSFYTEGLGSCICLFKSALMITVNRLNRPGHCKPCCSLLANEPEIGFPLCYNVLGLSFSLLLPIILLPHLYFKFSHFIFSFPDSILARCFFTSFFTHDVIRTHILLCLYHNPSCPKQTHKQNHTYWVSAGMQQNTTTEMGKNSICSVQVKYSSSLSHLKDHIKTSQSTPTGITMSETADKDRKGEIYDRLSDSPLLLLLNKMPNASRTSETGI